MPRPRRKPFWRWTPLPWLVLLLLLFGTGTLQDAHAGVWFVVALIVTIAYAIAFLGGLVIAGRRRGANFTAEGQLASLAGLTLHEAHEAGHPSTVADVSRHQHDIDAVRAFAGSRPQAVLVPDVGTWWGLRSDVAVYLLAGDRIYRAGRLGDQAQVAWQGELEGLHSRGAYAAVPAVIRGTARPFAVDVRLEGLRP